MNTEEELQTITIPVVSADEHLTPTGIIWLKENAGKRDGVHRINEDTWHIDGNEADLQNAGCHRMQYIMDWAADNGFDEVRFAPGGMVVQKVYALG